MMVPPSALVRVLRDAGFVFKRAGRRRDTWKRRGSTDVVLVLTGAVSDSIATTVLLQAKFSKPEIERFFAQWRQVTGV